MLIIATNAASLKLGVKSPPILENRHCRLRWKTLRERYVKDLKTAPNSSWKYFNAMSFLKEYLLSTGEIVDIENKADSGDLLLAIIEEVQRYRFLYDTDHRDYDNEKLKDEAWLRIARAVESQAEECRMHWKSLCEQFKTAYKNEDRTMWKPYYTGMLFMVDFLNTESPPSTPIIIPATSNKPKTMVICNQGGEDFNELLIKCVKKYSILFDHNHIDYNSKELKDQAWSKIANELCESVEKCQIRWRSFRERFIIYIKKNKDPEKCPWKYANMMEFLRKYISEYEMKMTSADFDPNREPFEYILIEEVKKYPCIYDRSNLYYHNREVKDQVWCQIAVCAQNTEERCRGRWKSLRDRFVKEYFRVVSIGDESSWKYYNDMRFLLNYLDTVKSDEEKLERTFENKLISEVRKYEYMYNRDHLDGRNKELRQRTWTRIATVVGASAEQCKRRWKSLRDVALKEHWKKLQDRNYISVWKHMENMLFVTLYTVPQRKVDYSFAREPASPSPQPTPPSTKKISQREMYCRTCVQQIRKEDGTSINNATSYDIFETVDLIEMLRMCLNQNIQSADEYPQSICEKCYNKILDFCQFKLMCKNSLEKFNDLVKNTKQMSATNNNFGDSMDRDNDNNSMDFSTDEKFADNEGLLHQVKCEIYEVEDSMENVNYCSRFDNKDGVESNDDDEHPRIKIELDEYKITDPLAIENNLSCEKAQTKEDDNHQYRQTSTKTTTANTSTPTNSYSTRKPPYKCDLCSKVFTLYFRLQAHRRQHRFSMAQDYRCTYEKCLRSFATIERLQMHLDDHKNEHSFKCNVGDCEKVYNTHYNLNQHKMSAHKCEKEKPVYACEKCGKTYENAIQLKAHRYIHKDDSLWPYVCDEPGCKAKFKTLSLYRIHKRRHSGIKNHICQYCGQGKYTAGELNRHMNIHTFARKYPCPHCPMVCKSSAYRRLHIRKVHKQPEEYPCRRCDAQFTSDLSRKHHELSHKGVIGYPCDECDQIFKWKTALKRHKNQSHTGEERPFECDICGKQFVWRKSVKKHKETCHKEDNDSTLKEQRHSYHKAKDKSEDVEATDKVTTIRDDVSNDTPIIVETNDVSYADDDLLMADMVEDVEYLIEEDENYVEYLLEEIE
ncbi:uncharacterized protein LOC101890092 isoform X2 [Musca domestica]|uniref:Uncharacterized protein LOC101890092 isoform X2 n=1 Tax=Musca domestica TaxID=7370 RepID=A0ABM3VQW0_MUSDO|nr:uncharacterized protein LOC101890092 isoform X2 [Musca domestica]